MLEDLIVVAIADAQKKAAALAQEGDGQVDRRATASVQAAALTRRARHTAPSELIGDPSRLVTSRHMSSHVVTRCHFLV